MKKLIYVISSILIFIPFCMGFIIGFFGRGFLSGFLTGYYVLQTNLQADVLLEVEQRARDRQISRFEQTLESAHLTEID
jgi:hypothetical protein